MVSFYFFCCHIDFCVEFFLEFNVKSVDFLTSFMSSFLSTFFSTFFPRCKSTALNTLVDQSSRVVTALLKEYHNLWIHCSRQQSFVKDTTDFISFIEKTKTGKDTILVSMDVSL